MNIMNNKDQSGNTVNLIQNSLNDLDKNILFVQNINYHLNTLKNNFNDAIGEISNLKFQLNEMLNLISNLQYSKNNI